MENSYNPRNEKLDVWELIENGNFEEAAFQADIEFQDTQSVLSLRNKLYALFLMGKYFACQELSNKIIEIRKGETDSDFSFLGIAYWLLSREKEAIAAWKMGEKSKYTDAAGGVELQIFLFFAAVKTSDQKMKITVVKRIKRLIGLKKAFGYPAILGAYLLGEVNKIDLLSSVSNVDILRERQLCQIGFVFAIKDLEMNNIELYNDNLKTSISYGSKSYLEQMYYLAKGELDKIKQ